MNPLINLKAMWRIAVLVILMPISCAFAGQTVDSAKISKTFEQARIHAAQINDDADLLESYARTGYSWQMHAKCMQDIKMHTTVLLADFNQLKAMREKGTPRQREAIDRLEPLLLSMTVALSTTVQYLNQNHIKVNMEPYRNRVRANWTAVNRVYSHLCECTDKNSKI